ncbi:MAG: RiPP maturation radical SAM C-methyltransferase [Thermodesulfobacteriota bacterium]
MSTNSLPDRSRFRLGLISMPWAIFNRPSIQLGALKAYLDSKEDIDTHLFHPYLDIAKVLGTNRYHHLALKGWAGEALYSSLLFPEQRESCRKLFNQEIKTISQLTGMEFDDTAAILQTRLDNWFDSVQLEDFQLIGFSVCFNQLLASLYAAAKIKERYPNCRIVFGGSSCVGEIGQSLVDNFDQVDYVISGEGEEQLFQLCRGLDDSFPGQQLPHGVMRTRTQPDGSPGCPAGIKALDTLPLPDYGPYFTELNRHFPGQPFIPVLPLEFSRGCWWNRCTFCNLNLQWIGYRRKSGRRVFEELQQLSEKYGCLDFTFCDNALPLKEADDFFNLTAGAGADYSFFGEIRVITKPEVLRRYRKGGLTSIQVGIEALSSGLLKKMAKGTKVIENICAMKFAAQHGIQLEGNLICEFPGSDETDVEQTLTTLEFILPFAPLSSAAFFLGHGSPILKNRRENKIMAVTDHPKNRALFPRHLLSSMEMLIKSYRGDRGIQQALWKPVNKRLQAWHSFHTDRHPARLPALWLRDGGSFLIIRQEMIDGTVLQHRLRGLSRRIYLFCTAIRTVEEVEKQFPSVSTGALETFLQDLNDKRLLFRENDQILALGVSSAGN